MVLQISLLLVWLKNMFVVALVISIEFSFLSSLVERHLGPST